MNDRRLFTGLLFAIVGVSVIASGCGGASSANSNTNTQPTTIDVTTAQAVMMPIPQYIEATGNLASDAQTDVAPAVAGKIVEVNFDIGSYVTQGSVLIRLDDRDARIRLDQARAQVDQQKKNVDTAIAAMRQAQIRLGVRDGEVFDIETFSQVKSSKANLVLAEKELTRAERLYTTGDVSKSILDQRRAQRDALLGQLDESRSNAAVAVRAINSAESQVAAARSGVTTAVTQVAQAEKALNDTRVLAPISGYISERNSDVGEYISPSVPNSKVATIVRTSTLRVKIDIPEQSIGKVATGQGISLQTSAYPDRSFAGSIVRISPGLNTQARTLTVEADVQNVDGLLKPGQFATVRITQSKPENAVMIPVKAVRTEGESSRVFIVKDGAAREQFVQLGLLENEMIQVKSGVAEGDSVATSNLNLLTDGIFVRQ